MGFIQLPVLRGKHAELAHQAGLARSNNDACVRARCVRVALLPSNTSFRSMCLFVDTLPSILLRPGNRFWLTRLVGMYYVDVFSVCSAA